MPALVGSREIGQVATLPETAACNARRNRVGAFIIGAIREAEVHLPN